MLSRWASDDGLLSGRISRPEIPRQHVERPRLQAALDVATAGRVTLVIGGAGWGKTLCVASWAARASRTRSVAWLTLDADDDDPRAFWSHLLPALRGSGAVRPDSPLAQLDPAGGFSRDALRSIQVGLAQLSHPVVLVVDDVHEVQSADGHDQLAVLLQRDSPLRLVLVSRTEPRLALQRLRVSGEVAEVRADDLALSAAEARELFARQGVVVVPGELQELLERTDGWPAGLRLAAMFLQRPGAQVSDFRGSDRAVSDYFMSEVVAAQSPQTWDFLLQTCLVPRICGDLADTLTGADRGLADLDQLEQENAFVTALGADRHWFRYHPLLSDMLRRQLQLERPALVPGLHERAARWFARHGQPVDAVRHAVAGGHWDLAGTLLTTVAADRLLSTDRHALGVILSQIPPVERARSPELLLCAVAVRFVQGGLSEVSGHLTEARALLDGQGDDANPSTSILVDLFESAVGRTRGDPSSIVQATTRALDTLDRSGPAVPLADEFRAIALGSKGVGLLWQGEFAAAATCLHAGLGAARAAGVELSKVNTLGHLALADAHAGQLRRAAALADRSRELAGARGWTELLQVTTAFLAGALVSLARNDLDEAEDRVTRGLEAQRLETERPARLALQITQAAIDIAAGRLEVGLDELDEIRDSCGPSQPAALLRELFWSTQLEAELAAGNATQSRAHLEALDPDERLEEETVLLARARFATGEIDGLDQLLAPVVRRPRTTRLCVQSSLVLALVADRRRRDDEAMTALDRAVSAAEAEGMVAPFLGAGTTPLPSMLERLLVLRPDLSSFLGVLSANRERSVRPAQPAPTDQLTDRERTVLRYLAAMLTNAEIAELMFLSPNTIKVHVRHVYSKLGVTSRRAAVRRALELHVLDAPPDA